MDVIAWLHSQGDDPDRIDNYAQTPIYYAAKEGHLLACQKLVEIGAKPGHMDDQGQNALFYACKNGHLEVVKFLVSTGELDVNHKDVNGKTVVFYAKKYRR